MKIAILGTGAFGMALASIFDNNKCQVKMWTNSEKEKKILLTNKKSDKINYDIPDSIFISTNMEEVVSEADIIAIAIPAQFVRDVCNELKNYYDNKQIIGIFSKGIEQYTGLLLYDIIYDIIKTNKIAVVAGGTFAEDIIKKVPIGFTVATKDERSKDNITKAIKSDYVKLRYTDDIIGTEICSSIKNVMAIASGIIGGLNYPESTKMLFICEIISDIDNLITKLGGNEKTIMMYSGIGDLLLTCTSEKSRNYTLGMMFGKDKRKEEINNYINNTTTEGLYTIKAIKVLLEKEKIEMSIINIINDIIEYKLEASALIDFLMNK